MSSNTDHPRTYRIELIIALITAVTGITVSIITNWDKIFKGQTSDLTRPPQDTTDLSKMYLYPGGECFVESAVRAQTEFENGWDIDFMQLSTLQKDSTHTIAIDLNNRYEYKITIFSDDPDAAFKGEFYNLNLKQGSEDFIMKDSMEFSVSDFEIDFDGIYFNIVDQKFPVTFSILIVSKNL